MKHEEKYSLQLLTTGGNYLHTKKLFEIDEVMLVRSLLLDQEFTDQDIEIKEDDGYFRLYLRIKDTNGEPYIFHSRKMNLNDVTYERDEILA